VQPPLQLFLHFAEFPLHPLPRRSPSRPSGQQQPPADFADSTSLPSGRRGERIRQTIDAINSGDDRRIEALVTDAFGGRFRELPVAEHQAELLGRVR
jgi:hypothetical protein